MWAEDRVAVGAGVARDVVDVGLEDVEDGDEAPVVVLDADAPAAEDSAAKLGGKKAVARVKDALLEKLMTMKQTGATSGRGRPGGTRGAW